jgi:hypothetical protein
MTDDICGDVMGSDSRSTWLWLYGLGPVMVPVTLTARGYVVKGVQ